MGTPTCILTSYWQPFGNCLYHKTVATVSGAIPPSWRIIGHKMGHRVVMLVKCY